MPKYVVTVDSLDVVENAAKIREGALTGLTIPSVTSSHTKGDVIELPKEEADRHLESGALEEPGESQKREQEQLRARQAELQAQADALDAQAKAAGTQARSAKSGG